MLLLSHEMCVYACTELEDAEQELSHPLTGSSSPVMGWVGAHLTTLTAGSTFIGILVVKQII